MTASAHATFPIVDFAPFLFRSNNLNERIETGTAIFEAFRDIGFVYLTNHGVPQELIWNAFAMSRAFFNLPLEDKLKAPHPPESWNQRGYSRVGLEKLSLYPDRLNTGTPRTASPPTPIFENKESFDIGRENDSIMPNIWPPPPILPDFRPTMTTLFDTLHDFGQNVLQALALGLQLEDASYFSRFHGRTEDPMNQLRLLHYPAVSRHEVQKGDMTRIVPHTDKGTITLLLQEDDGVGGLEVQTHSGEYVLAPLIPGAILVNVGDLLQMWSNEVLKSTRHHIGLPDPKSLDLAAEGEGEVLVPRRFSIPYFVAPDRDAVVECLESKLCWGEERPKKYEPVKAWDYIFRSMSGAYEKD